MLAQPTPSAITTGMTLKDFVRLYDEAPFELIDGERILLVPPLARHVVALKLLYDLLVDFTRKHKSGQVFPEAPFVLIETADWVTGSRVPDILFYTAQRWSAYIAANPDWGDKPFILVPDLCVEIVSKNDSYDDIDSKVQRYLNDGVRLVWVVNPRNQTVIAYRGNSDQITRLTEEHTLTGEDVLPGFSVPVKSLFAQPE